MYMFNYKDQNTFPMFTTVQTILSGIFLYSCINIRITWLEKSNFRLLNTCMMKYCT